MTDREKLMRLLLDMPFGNSTEEAEIAHTEAVADYLIANGVTFKDRDIHWATEQAYKNGYEAGKPKWIPVTERLPDENGKYLVHENLWGTSHITAIRFAKDGEKVCSYDLKGQKNVWYKYDSEIGYFPAEYVTHWMPLPEMPEGE